MALHAVIAVLGLLTGFLSGLLGIGGGIVMAPLLLYLPPLVGLEALSMRTVAGLTIVQGLAAAIAGALAHRKLRFVADELVRVMGIAVFLAALVGGAAARFVPNRGLLAIFGVLALAAAALILVPNVADSDSPDVGALRFSRLRAAASAAGVGLLGGMVGQGGSFLLIPLMTSFVRVPTRIAIGSNLAIVLLATAAAFVGKAATGQIAWSLAAPLVLVVPLATVLGSSVSRRVPVGGLRKVLAAVIALAAVWIWISVLAA